MENTEKFDLIVKMEEKDVQEDYDEEMVIEQIGKQINCSTSYYIKETEFFNIFMVELSKHDFNTALKLAKASDKHNYKMVPIESVVLTRPGKIMNQIINISKNKINSGDTFAIRCNIRGRRYIKSKEKFISTIYREIKKINGRPDEIQPNWIIHIEVIGENTGISVLKRNI